MTKAEQVIQIAVKELGAPYVYAQRGQDCTPKNRGNANKSYGADNPTIKSKCQVLTGSKSDCSGCKYNGRRMYDCRGYTYWVFKQVGITISGVGATTQYNTSKNWSEKGEIAAMPKNKVCCVFKYIGGKMQHTGIWLPDKQKIIDCSGEVAYHKLTSTWTHYAIPKGLYEGSDDVTITIPTGGINMATLKKGSKGDAVAELQARLNALGFDSGEIDGVYGTKTVAAVKAYQAANDLKVDGIAGAQTLTKILAEVITDDANPAPEQTTEDAVTITFPRSVFEQLKAAFNAVN